MKIIKLMLKNFLNLKKIKLEYKFYIHTKEVHLCLIKK